VGKTRRRVTVLVLGLEALGFALLIAALWLALLGDLWLALILGGFAILWLSVISLIMREFLGLHTPWWWRFLARRR
jgi:hypothetical protein